ncbi:hypothetical protein ACIQ4I_13225 [Rummeliibacillus sp. NPDC094406]|uniref:hypothetical protein n=1 Tax=Rummeliibacillus sp. NPDC094406 TaxID=3364511 RepID=UPI0037F554EB
MFKQRNNLFKKSMLISTIVAGSLLFGTTWAEAKTVEVNKVNATAVSTSTKTVATSVSKKGVLTLPKNFKTSTVKNELKPEAAKLIKIYGGSLKDGKTTTFNSYVNKHVAPHTKTDYLLGHQYTKDDYSKKVKGTRKVNSKDSISKYSKAVMKVTTSKVKNSYAHKGDGWANFSYDFQPENYSPMNTVTIYFRFTQLKNGQYVLENIHYY